MQRDPKGCPYVDIIIINKHYEMLVDSRAEVSVISAKYLNDIQQDVHDIPTLPLVGMSIHLAVGEKPTKVTRQIPIPTKLGEITIQTPFIVVDNLNENGILSSDFLELNNATIDYIKKQNNTTNKCREYIFANKENNCQHITNNSHINKVCQRT